MSETDDRPAMTAPTPDQMRALADALMGPMPMAQLDRTYAALRAAADQLEAVREALWGGRVLTPAVVRVANARQVIPRLTADTGPQEKATAGARSIPGVRDMTPGSVFTALHIDPDECGGVEHRWFVFWSKDYGNAVYNDEGQRWSADSIDFDTVRNYTAPQEDRDDPYEGQDWDWSNPR